MLGAVVKGKAFLFTATFRSFVRLHKANIWRKEIREELGKGVRMGRMGNERFDNIVIPENLSQRVRQGIREGEKIYMRNKRRKLIMRMAGAAAALFMCMCFFAAQPALAAKIPIIRDIFKLLQGEYSYQGDLGSVAHKFEDSEGIDGKTEGKLKEQGDTEGNGSLADSAYTKTVNGVTVSVSEAYCSVEAIYLSFMIVSQETFPDTMIDQDGKPIITFKGSAEYSFREGKGEAEGYGGGASGQLEGTFIDEHTYAGIYRIDILDLVGNDDELKEKYRALDAFDMDFTIKQIVGNKAQPEELDMRGKTQEELEAMTDEEWQAFMNEIVPQDWYKYPNQYENWWFDGPFVFSLHIEMDKEGAQVVTVDEMNDTGAGLYQVVKTKFEITVEEKCSKERTESGVFLVVLDAEGRILPYGSSSFADTYAINGRDVSKVYVYVCDYVEYMDEIKGHCEEEGFQQILKERALYGKEIVF